MQGCSFLLAAFKPVHGKVPWSTLDKENSCFISHTVERLNSLAAYIS
jgi:hypothetical protein